MITEIPHHLDDKSLTGELILPSRTANQYLARARYWFAVRDGKPGPDIGSRFATVKLVHRSEIYHKSSPPRIEPQSGELMDHR
jgi:hypothetical protein